MLKVETYPMPGNQKKIIPENCVIIEDNSTYAIV